MSVNTLVLFRGGGGDKAWCEMAERVLIGPLNGKFKFCKQQDGTVDKLRVTCVLCKKEFAYRRSCSSLNYHLNAKHPAIGATSNAANVNNNASGTGLRQTTIEETVPVHE